MPEDRLDDLLAEELMQTYSPFPGPFERGVVACTGSEFCRFAVVETKERAVKWARALDAQLSADDDGWRTLATTPGVIRMHFSGCSASCAQPQIADIGFRGDIAHVDEQQYVLPCRLLVRLRIVLVAARSGSRPSPAEPGAAHRGSRSSRPGRGATRSTD